MNQKVAVTHLNEKIIRATRNTCSRDRCWLQALSNILAEHEVSPIVATKAVQGLVAGLENEGVIKFIDTEIEYKVPKLKQ
jgi:hypothetical protein